MTAPPSAQATSPSMPVVLWTAEDLAARWQVPKSQVYRLAREGRIPKVEIGRYYRFKPADIEAFESGAAESESVGAPLSNGAQGERIPSRTARAAA